MDRPSPSIPDYELLRRIGRGSYGEVWLARSVTGLYRAVKIIYRHQFEEDRPYDREFAGIKCFEPISRSNESQVDILHVGRNDSAGYFYYVMELADDAREGDPAAVMAPDTYIPKTLKVVLAEHHRLTVSETLPIAISLAEALTHLHTNGLVHRDVKPSNIIFVKGRPKLADIGLIAITDASRSFVGTEGFVPREGPGTPQADIFALGKVLYETCTGRDRLEFPSLPEHLETLPDRSELGELNEVLIKACDPDPTLRYASSQDLKNDLELIRARKSVRRLRKLERTVRRGRRLAVVGTLAAMVVGIGWFQSHRFNRMAAAQLAHVYVKNGQERLEQNDWLGGLPWFAKALDLESGVRDRQPSHCLRIANMLEWCPRLSALYTHARPVRYAFFDAEANRVLLCDSGTTAQIWDPASDQPIGPRMEHGGQPFLASFSPDGTRVATASRGDGAARIWDARTGAPLNSPIHHGKQVATLAFSPNGLWLATAGQDGLARLWRAEDGKETSPPLDHGTSVTLLAFSDDSRRLLTVGEPNGGTVEIRIWETGTGQMICAAIEEPGPINAALFSPSGDAIITGSATGELCLWTLVAHPLRLWRQSMGHPIVRSVFSPDGSRVLAASEWSARLWDAHSGQPLGSLIRSSGVLRSAEFSHDGSRFLLAGESRTALIYDTRTGLPQIPLIKHGGEIYKAFFLKDDHSWITASADGTVRRWNFSQGATAQAMFVHPHPVKSLMITPDNHFIITTDDQGGVRRLPLNPGATQAEDARELPAEAIAATLSGDGQQILLATRDATLRALSVTTLELVGTVSAPAAGVERIVSNPRKAQAALSTRDGSVWLWDWQRGTTESFLAHGSGVPPEIAFSADGSILAVASARSVLCAQLAESSQGKQARIQHEDRVWHIGFDANGRRLLVSSEDRVMRWWDPSTGASLGPPMRGDGGINFAEFSADQQRVFTTSANYDAMIWNAVSGKPLTPAFKPRPGLTGATFSSDNNWIAITSNEGSLQVWDASTGEPMTPPLATIGPVSLCRFSPNGRWLATIEGGTNVICRPFLLESISPKRSLDQAALLSGYRVDDHGFLVPLNRIESAQLAKQVVPPPDTQSSPVGSTAR